MAASLVRRHFAVRGTARGHSSRWRAWDRRQSSSTVLWKCKLT